MVGIYIGMGECVGVVIWWVREGVWRCDVAGVIGTVDLEILKWCVGTREWIFVWFSLGGNPVWGDGPNRPESERQIPRYSADTFSNFYCKFDLVHF